MYFPPFLMSMNKAPQNKKTRRRQNPSHPRQQLAPKSLLHLFETQKKLLTLEEISQHLGLAKKKTWVLERELTSLITKGRLLRDRRGRYGLTEKLDVVQGKVSGHRDGFGFLIRETGPDLYLSAREMRRVMDGDLVLARIIENPRDGRLSGTIVDVLQRRHQKIIGTIRKQRKSLYLTPEDSKISQDILIDDPGEFDLKDGQIAEVELLQYPEEHRPALGKVIDLLGEQRTPKLEMEVAIRKHQLPNHWPESIATEIDALPTKVTAKDTKNRENLRHIPFVTIDGEDAKDFDDAVYCRNTDTGFELMVAIADVAHYVRPGSAIDQEALERGTSAYFPDRVIPMLPPALSEHLCSLQPKQDRLAVVCSIQTDQLGRVLAYRFIRSVIHSQARTTYEQVAGFLAGQDEFLTSDPVKDSLRCLFHLYQQLDHQRQIRGTIDFDSAEVKILLGENGLVSSIEARERNDAHKVIEECMILANCCAAEFLLEKKLPFLSRIHESPDPEKISALREFLKEFGLTLEAGDQPTSAQFAKMLESAVDRPDYQVIQNALLRSMKRAVYAPGEEGHFGLALEAYTHFTSPIRRYPDLLTHRAILHGLRNRKATSYLYTQDEMVELGLHCSMAERRADETLWDIEAWLKCEFMSNRLGEVFQATVSSVTGFGLFVTLDELYIDGLIHVTSLPNDYYHLDWAKHRLVGERAGKSFQLGDRLSVKLAAVNLDEHKIDLTLN